MYNFDEEEVEKMRKVVANVFKRHEEERKALWKRLDYRLKNYLDDFYRDLSITSFIHLQEDDYKYRFEDMKHILDEMGSSEDQRFYEYFEKKFNIVSKEFQYTGWAPEYNKKIGHKTYLGYCLNLYIVLKAYSYHKDDFDTFCAVVDDIEGMDQDVIRKMSSFVEYFDRRKNLIDYVVSNKDYKTSTHLRNFMRGLIQYHDNLGGQLFFLNTIVYDMCCLKMKNNDLDIDLVSIFDYIIKNCNDRDCSEYQEKFAYSNILLIGDRFPYFVEKINSSIGNDCFKKEIIGHMNRLSFGLFEELNEDSDKDSFIRCMDIIFDSDSYNELFNKFFDLEEACSLYDRGEKKDAFEIIREFNSDKYKDIYYGKKVMYLGGMNKIQKPKLIINRMIELYSRIDDSISYDFMLEKYSNSEGTIAFDKALRTEIARRKSFWGKTKMKIKGYFSGKK